MATALDWPSATGSPAPRTGRPSPQPPGRPAALVRGVQKRFDERWVLDGCELAVARGEVVALVGPPGSGKTTILRLLRGVDAPTSGEVFVPRILTAVDPDPSLVPSLRVWRNVVAGLPRRQATRSAASAALAEVGLGGRGHAWPYALTDEEALRVALARALVRSPDLVLLDDPFSALDTLARRRLQGLIAELCAHHRPGVLLVTHDVEEALLLADRVVVLRDGRIDRDLVVDPSGRDRPGGVRLAALRRDLLDDLAPAT